MVPLFAEISARIPANKFYPPRFAASQTIFRPRLIESCLANRGRGKKVFLFEAQAGQGKTTLAAQYLQHTHAPYVWYQVGIEDRDPVLLLTALLASLKRALPEFSAPQLEKMLVDGEVSVLELRSAVNLLLADLDLSLAGDFFIVFDDFHLLDGFAQSLAVVDYVIETSPPHLRFILISRWTVPLQTRIVKFSRDALQLTNHDLALSEEEVALFLRNAVEEPVPASTVRALQHATDGWVMGIILASHVLERGNGMGRLSDTAASIHQGEIPAYFKEEIFLHLPEALRLPLLKLSLLDEIPVALAQEITGQAGIGNQLEKLMEQNYFVRGLNEEGTLFSLHHLFQEFLQERAQAELDVPTIDDILHRAAAFWVEHKRPQKAVLYYLRARDYGGLERILEQEGMALMAMNRLATLYGVLQGIPVEVIKKTGWFSYFYGVVSELAVPQTSLPYFETARINFIKEEDLVGELLAIAEIINFHMAYDGAYNQGIVHLRRAEELFQRHAEELDTFTKILVAHDLASGCCFFEMDMTKANHYSAYALELAQRNELDNFIGRIRVIQGFEYLLQGRYADSIAVAEQAYGLIYSPRVDVVSRAGLRTLLLDLLVKTGEFDAMARLEQETYAAPEGRFVPGAITLPLLMTWKAEVAMAGGDLAQAEKIIQQGLQSGFYGETPHLRSQFLHILACIYAIWQRKGEAIDALEESRRLRAEVGGPYYQVLNDLMSGITYAHLGMAEQAETYLRRTVEGAKRIGVDYFRACALLHSASFRLRAKRPKKAMGKELAEGLAIMRQYGYVHVHGWYPETMRELLRAAVNQGIEREYARNLARQRLGIRITDEGEVFPLLRIRILGGFALGCNDSAVMLAQDFTPGQRQILAMLLCAPNHQLRQEQVQVAMWPESNPEKARSKFDSALSRLRKSMGEVLGEETMRRSLVLKKGILSLEECWVDAQEFLQEAATGREKARSNHWWQAGVAFEKALALWQRCEIDTFAENEQVAGYCATLALTATEVAVRWSGKQREMGRHTEAIATLRQVLRHDPGNDVLVKHLYRVYIVAKEGRQAQELLQHFAEHLRKAEYTEAEIKESLAEIREAEARSADGRKGFLSGGGGR
jgi:ATP/maltotriose-dependent transcriptional regulator MalT/DNA-binding SARP family transcriptional activator